jgi:hypothetical protein
MNEKGQSNRFLGLCSLYWGLTMVLFLPLLSVSSMHESRMVCLISCLKIKLFVVATDCRLLLRSSSDPCMSFLSLISLSTVTTLSELAFSVVVGAKLHETLNLSLLLLLPPLKISTDKCYGCPGTYWIQILIGIAFCNMCDMCDGDGVTSLSHSCRRNLI